MQICPRNFLQMADSDIIVSLHLVILSDLWLMVPEWNSVLYIALIRAYRGQYWKYTQNKFRRNLIEGESNNGKLALLKKQK